MSAESKYDPREKKASDGLSVRWVLLSLATGLTAAILVGRFYNEGPAEIAGIMVTSAVAGTRVFWEWRVKAWFAPLLIGWALSHLSLLFFVVVPMNVHESRSLINLVWVEFFAFAGLVWLASRLWGGIPE